MLRAIVNWCCILPCMLSPYIRFICFYFRGLFAARLCIPRIILLLFVILIVNLCILSGICFCIVLFYIVSFCRFCLIFVFVCSRWSFVDVPLIFSCPADHVLDWQPRSSLDVVEAHPIGQCQENTHTHTHTHTHTSIIDPPNARGIE